jgi:hypothetical protein
VFEGGGCSFQMVMWTKKQKLTRMNHFSLCIERSRVQKHSLTDKHPTRPILF